jgi:GMP reductase
MRVASEIALGYKDVFLVPNKCTVRSRKEVDTSYTLDLGELDISTTEDIFNQRKKVLPLYKNFKLPIIPANMKSVVDYRTYELYSELGLMPIMHRFDVDFVSFLSGVYGTWRAISVGVNNEDLVQLERVSSTLTINKHPHLICIDVAHGHTDRVKEMIHAIKTLFKELCPIIMAGNVTTPEAVEDLQSWGVNIIKVGIGPGQVCSTKNKTGFHVPMFTAIKECSLVAKVPIVADGGFRENGDIAKALVAGADLVMIGGMFAACTDSPAVIIDGKKEYYGSASAHNKGYNQNIEGFHIHLNPTMSIKEKVEEIQQDLQSAISYSGGKDLSALDISKVKYNIVQ